ncbi:hypothetical protein ACFVR1_06785 [Psychrobacillus sp. NPDC058041]|uniref:hypothetical protein n=1 Tax=Psychrobacillus sp. NPDC058041 TaxID=3346310 RepID=UPI0036DDD449
MKWKKTGAALLVTTLTVTSAGYAFANNQLFDTVDLSKLSQKPATSPVVATVSEKPVTPSKTTVEVKTTNQTNNLQENGLPKIPADYPYDNLKGLYKAYENVQNPKAKEEIKLKIQYLIAKYEVAKEYKNDDAKEQAKKQEELKKEALKEQEKLKKEALKKQQEAKKEELKKQHEAKKEVHKEQKEQEKEIKKAQKELRKEMKEKEKELHKAEKHQNKHNEKNKHKNENEDNDED